MGFALPLTGSNIAMAAAMAGVETQEVIEQLRESESRAYDAQVRRYASQIMGQDEAWYDETMDKINEIAETLSPDMDNKERMLALYGWVRPKNGNLMGIIMSKCDIETHCHAVSIIMHQPYLYDKINSWD